MLFSRIDGCRICGGQELTKIRRFDHVLPAGLYTDEPSEISLPLTLLQCEQCNHVQLEEIISPEIYADYIYVTPPASSLDVYLEMLADELKEKFTLKGKSIFEIGSSNGSFLKYFKDENEVLGLEPSGKLAEMAKKDLGIETVHGYLGETELNDDYDVIFCRHVLEHINDVPGFTDSAISVCKPGTLLLIEVPSFDQTLAHENYSNIFHEHVNYFSFGVLLEYYASRGFRLVYDYTNEIHGGSMGLVFEYTGSPIAVETQGKVNAALLYARFDDYLEKVTNVLLADSFIGYGAAHRTFTLLSMLNLIDKVDYIVDKNPGYKGKYIGGSNLRIASPERLLEESGREVILFASSYENEILADNEAALKDNTFILVGEKVSRINASTWMALKVRRHIVGMKFRSGSSHAGSALSVTDILAVIYSDIAYVDPANPSMKERDRVILSKGHSSAALYATLAERGFFSVDKLQGFYSDEGELPGHVDMTAAPGIEASSGSLGHGLSLGVGMAIAQKADAIDARVFVVCGDGEMDEGSVWEAVMFAPKRNLNNLVMIVDNNHLQGYVKDSAADSLLTEEKGELVRKLDGFGWRVITVDGHDHSALRVALSEGSDRPVAIIAETTKGKGVSYMEGEFIWHYKSPNEEQYSQALDELL